MNRQERKKAEAKIAEAQETIASHENKIQLAARQAEFLKQQILALQGYVQGLEELLGKRKEQKTKPDAEKQEEIRGREASDLVAQPKKGKSDAGSTED